MKFGIRWYNPTTGTWTQQDTLDAPLDPANANRYVFVGGDPINGLDSTGTESEYCKVNNKIGEADLAAGGATAICAGLSAPVDAVPVAGEVNLGIAGTAGVIEGFAGLMVGADELIGGC